MFRKARTCLVAGSQCQFRIFVEESGIAVVSFCSDSRKLIGFADIIYLHEWYWHQSSPAGRNPPYPWQVACSSVWKAVWRPWLGQPPPPRTAGPTTFDAFRLEGARACDLP